MRDVDRQDGLGVEYALQHSELASTARLYGLRRSARVVAAPKECRSHSFVCIRNAAEQCDGRVKRAVTVESASRGAFASPRLLHAAYTLCVHCSPNTPHAHEWSTSRVARTLSSGSRNATSARPPLCAPRVSHSSGWQPLIAREWSEPSPLSPAPLLAIEPEANVCLRVSCLPPPLLHPLPPSLPEPSRY